MEWYFQARVPFIKARLGQSLSTFDHLLPEKAAAAAAAAPRVLPGRVKKTKQFIKLLMMLAAAFRKPAARYCDSPFL